MKAIVYSGGVLKLEEIEKPVPADNEVLIKVRTASVNPLDYHVLRHPFLRPAMARLSKAKTLRPGRDVTGQVEAVGRNVTQFKPGDEVFGACNGAFAEYACARESALAINVEAARYYGDLRNARDPKIRAVLREAVGKKE